MSDNFPVVPNDLNAAEQYMIQRKEATFRWGTKTLRGGQWNYSPCVLDRTGWENFYLSLPYDYDIRNDPVFNVHRSTYKRLGDLGFSWPEPSTREATRTGYCGEDQNSLTRQAFLRIPENDRRPEPAYRLHLTDRTSLHHLRADPVEGVLPYGRVGDMTNSRSVMHRDYKWRLKCCAPLPQDKEPCLESRAYRFAKTDLHGDMSLPNRVVKFSDEIANEDFKQQEMIKVKKAFYWPIDPITNRPLGGRLLYYQQDPCRRVRKEIWPAQDRPTIPENPIVIPDHRCEVMAHGPRKEKIYDTNWIKNSSALDTTRACTNYCEEVPYRCCDDSPSDCCFKICKTNRAVPQKENDCPEKTCPQIKLPPCPSKAN